MKYDVSALGSATIDIVMIPKNISELKIDSGAGEKEEFLLLRNKSKIHVDNMYFTPGGNAANFCSNLSSLGKKTCYIGVVGKDFVGDMIRKNLKEEKIKAVLRTAKKISSPLAVDIQGKDDRTLLVYRGSSDLLSPKDIKKSEIENSEIFYASSVTSDSAIKAYRKALKFKNKFLFAPSITIIGKRKKETLEFMKKADFAVMNYEESYELTGVKKLEKRLRKMKEMGPEEVVITLGKKGSISIDKNGIERIKPRKIEAKNPNGAGDGFTAGYAYGKLKGWNALKSMKFGTLCAERIIRIHGSRLDKSERFIMKKNERSEMKIKTPVCAINFKTYPKSTGKNSLALSKNAEEAAKELGLERNMILIPALPDTSALCLNTSLPVLSQKVDPVKPGRNTGHVSLENVLSWGAFGTLLNHAENKIPKKDIEFVVRRAKELDALTLVCAKDNREAEIVSEFGPDMVAVEPPELIGSGISVSRAKPEVIETSVKKVKDKNKNILALCGAGISGGEDVKKALELGAEGILVASFVAKAEDQKEAVLELLSGF